MAARLCALGRTRDQQAYSTHGAAVAVIEYEWHEWVHRHCWPARRKERWQARGSCRERHPLSSVISEPASEQMHLTTRRLQPPSVCINRTLLVLALFWLSPGAVPAHAWPWITQNFR